MMKMKNTVHLEGYAYDHSLQIKEAGPNAKTPGAKYITGKLSIATDEDLLNIVDVRFRYVSENTSKGNPNPTFQTLKNIIDGVSKTVMSDGKDNALKIRVDSAFGLNEWYDQQGELKSYKENSGGFVHNLTALNPIEKDRNYFYIDFLITGVRNVEADPDRDLPEKLILKGAIFDYRNNLLPVEFSVVNPNAISYFESQNISDKTPFFTKLKGRQESMTIKRTITEEGAFGDAVREVTSTRKDCIITWASNEPYVFDSEDTILASELKEAMARRETELAALKSSSEEYKKTANNSAAAATVPASGAFNF